MPRSRSKSVPKKRNDDGRRSHSEKRGAAKTVKIARSISRHLRDSVIKTMSAPVRALAATQKKVALAKGGYFDGKDTKTDLPSLQKEVDQLNKELALVRTSLRAGLKDQPIRMRLSAPFVITTTVTTGVTNTVTIAGVNNKLDPTLCTEWSSLQALFDEFKCLGGEAMFVYTNSVISNTVTAVTSDSLPIMAYDADTSAAYTASVQASQASQHKVFAPVLASATGAGAPIAASSTTALHKFRWHVPRGDVVGPGTLVFPGTEWVTVNTTGPGFGYLQFYHVGSCVTAINTGAGWVYFDLEFRARS